MQGHGAARGKYPPPCPDALSEDKQGTASRQAARDDRSAFAVSGGAAVGMQSKRLPEIPLNSAAAVFIRRRAHFGIINTYFARSPCDLVHRSIMKHDGKRMLSVLHAPRVPGVGEWFYIDHAERLAVKFIRDKRDAIE